MEISYALILEAPLQFCLLCSLDWLYAANRNQGRVGVFCALGHIPYGSTVALFAYIRLLVEGLLTCNF